MTDPTNDTEPTPHNFESLPVDEYEAARAEREAALDAAHEKAKAEKEARTPVKRQHCGTCGTLQRIEYLDVRGRCESCAEQLPLFKESP